MQLALAENSPCKFQRRLEEDSSCVGIPVSAYCAVFSRGNAHLGRNFVLRAEKSDHIGVLLLWAGSWFSVVVGSAVSRSLVAYTGVVCAGKFTMPSAAAQNHFVLSWWMVLDVEFHIYR